MTPLMSLLRNRLRWLLGAAVCLLLPLSACAASLALDYTLGFNGYFQLGSWTPFTVTLDNRGRTVTGTLEVVVTSGSELDRTIHQTTYAMDVELPYNSTKLCAFTIFINSFTHDLLIRLRQTDTLLLSETISLRGKYAEKRLAVVLDERMTPDFLTVLPQSLFPVNAQPRFLPETWYGYDGVEMLIVNAEVFKTLRDRQFQALTEWVRQGGLLITSAGMNAGVFLEDRLQEFLPLRVLGHQPVTALTSLEAFCGQSLTSDSPFLLLRTSLPDAQPILQEQAIPVLFERAFGAGKVAFIAFDLQHPPFSRWGLRRQFWEQMLTFRPVNQRDPIVDRLGILLPSLFERMPEGLPDVKIVMGFLAVYVVLLKILQILFHRRHGIDWRHITAFFVLMVGCSIGSYLLFFFPNQRKHLAYDGLWQLHLSGKQHSAEGTYIIGLYALKNTTYDLGFGRTSYPITRLMAKSQGNAPDLYAIREEETGRRIQGNLTKWSYNFFMLTANLQFPLTGQAHWQDQTLSLTLDNQTDFRLQDCYLYVNGRVLPIGELVPHKASTREIATADFQAQEPFDAAQTQTLLKHLPPDEEAPFWQNMQRTLMKDVILKIQNTLQAAPDTLIVVGWMPTPLIAPDFNHAGVLGSNVTLITLEIPIEHL